MPHLPSWRRNGEPTDPTQLDELLGDGQESPAVSSEWQLVSELLQAAAGPASAAELTGEDASLAAFRRAHNAPFRRPLVRPRMISTLLTGKIAAALACAAVGITGAAGAAFAGALPTNIQNIAHDTIGAPQARHALAASADSSHSPDPSETPEASESAEATDSPKASESPDASQSAQVSATSTTSPGANAAFGLCVAWSNAVKHGLEGQVGFRDKLAGLAGGPANVTTFCASVKHIQGNDTVSVSPSGSVSPAVTSSDENGHGNGKGKSHSHGRSDVSPTASLAPQAG